MKIKELLTKRNVIIICIIIVLIILVIYLANNTSFFKTKDEIKNDLIQIQDDLNSDELASVQQRDITDSRYSNDVGVSGETLYIKENASSKIKDSVQGTDIGYEKSNKSVNGMVVLEAYEGTSVTGYELTNITKDEVYIEVYDYSNLISEIYIVGSVTGKEQIEAGQDGLRAQQVAPNTEYTLTNIYNAGINTVFFFDSNMKYISSTTDKTFTTPENAKYIKVITEEIDAEEVGLEETEIQAVLYNLVLGKEPGDNFSTNRSQITLTKENDYKGYIPFSTSKSVLYIDGAEIEFKYVSK